MDTYLSFQPNISWQYLQWNIYTCCLNLSNLGFFAYLSLKRGHITQAFSTYCSILIEFGKTVTHQSKFMGSGIQYYLCLKSLLCFESRGKMKFLMEILDITLCADTSVMWQLFFFFNANFCISQWNIMMQLSVNPLFTMEPFFTVCNGEDRV